MATTDQRPPPSSDEVISRFIETYPREFELNEKVAQHASELCKNLLASSGIRAIVSYRAKQPNQLKAKLRQRCAGGKEYENDKAIRDDIVDLSGVRIALYFPTDRVKIAKIIHDFFSVHKTKEFRRREESDTGSEQRFDGYYADHYRVRFKVNALQMADPQNRFKSATIEIQVASVLMHAWAEVNHDLVYKNLTGGPVSSDEHAILDAINGL